MGRDQENGPHRAARTGRIEYRPMWVLYLSVLVRAAHQVGAAIFLAAYLLGLFPGPQLFYVLVAALSGALLLIIEWLRHRQIFRELAGAVTLGKILLLAAAYHGLLPLRETVLLAFVLASIGAHVPKHVRHRLLF
jgi:hypothetical protein